MDHEEKLVALGAAVMALAFACGVLVGWCVAALVLP